MKNIIVRYFLFIPFINLYAETISYEDIVSKAITTNMKLKIVDSNKEITEAKIEELESLYYPTISIGLNAQYSKNLDDSRNGATSIGDTYFSNQSQYESSASLRINYDLYDFGVRSNKIKIAKIDRKLVDFSINETVQKLKLQLLELYTKLLSYKKELAYDSRIKQLQSSIYQQKKRLFDAGEIDKLTVASQAIALVELDTKIETIRSNIKEILTQLSFYTKENYTLNTNFAPLDGSSNPTLTYQESFTHQSFEAKKEQKGYELELLNSEQYPTVQFFGKYNFYGAKECSLGCAFQDMKKRNYLLGIGLNVPVFSGFKSIASKKRIKAEQLQITLQDQEQQAYFTQQQKENQFKRESISTQIEQSQKGIEEQQHKMNMTQRLLEQQEIDSISGVKEKIAAVYKQLALDKNLIDQSAKLKEMEILNEGGVSYE